MPNYYDENRGWVIDGMSLEDYEAQSRPLSPEELESLGLIEASTEGQAQEEANIKDQPAAERYEGIGGYMTRPDNMPYEKLGIKETWQDVANAIGVEASHIFHRRENESTYFARTRLADSLKTLYRFIAPEVAATLSLAAAGGLAGSIVPAAGTGAGAAGGAVVGAARSLRKVSQIPKLISELRKIQNSVAGGAVAGGISDAVVMRPEEDDGLLADLLPDTNLPVLNWFQSNENDSNLTKRLKAGVEGVMTGAAVGGAMSLIFNAIGKKFNKATQTSSKEQAQAQIEVAAAELDNTLTGAKLIEKVKKTMQQALEDNSDDVERYLLDSPWVDNEIKNDVLNIYEALNRGDEVIPLPDGTFSLQVRNWRDASKVDIQELQRQFTDPETGLTDGIPLMEDAVRDTWKERGLLSEGEELITTINPKDNTRSSRIKVNTKASNRIVKYYTDRWQIDNKVNVEWVEGTIKGADGNTSVTRYKGTKKNGDIHPDITIKINKNTRNPYAVLRSELEHARDIAKREVPDQSQRHFSRYDGINESEMSLRYVKKKADSRASSAKTADNISKIEDRYDFEVKSGKDLESVSNPDFDNIIIIKNKSGEVLGNMRTSNIGNDIIYVDMMNNYQTESGVGRAMIAKLAKDNPDKKIAWTAVSEGSVKSYNKFVDEYPDLVQQIEFKNEVNTIDEVHSSFYNTEKGVINEPEIYSSQQSGGSSQSLYGESQTSNRENVRISTIQNRSYQSQNRNRERESGSFFNGNGKQTVSNTLDNNQQRPVHQQSGIGETTQRPIPEQLISTGGDLNKVNQIIDNIIARDPELSGTTFRDLADDADEFYEYHKDILGDNIAAVKQAFADGDYETLERINRKALAAERVAGELKNSIIKSAAQEEDVTDLVEAVNYLAQYTGRISSAFGRGLNEQKVINKVRSFFDITTLENQGLESLRDILYTDLTSLNFTRNIRELKEEIYTKAQNYFGGAFFNQLINDPEYFKAFDKYLTQLITPDVTPEMIDKALRRLVSDTYLSDAVRTAQLTTSSKSYLKAVKRGAGYFINNLVSAPSTHLLGIISGLSNAVYYPFKKIVAGLLGGGADLKQEGIRQYQYLFGSYSTAREAFKMGKQVLATGEGTMINLSKKARGADTTDDYRMLPLSEAFESPNNFMDILFTMPCRLLGAADETISQLIYRSNIKAKAYNTAERGAEALGLQGDNKVWFIKDRFNMEFERAFNSEGRPMDLSAYAEAREGLMQAPLSGKMYDYNTESMVQIKPQSVTMNIGEGLQQLIQKRPELSFLFPFIRTPLNIMQMNLEHNFGYLIASPAQRKILISNTREGALLRAQAAMGALSFGVASSLCMSGLITGGAPLDRTTREALYKTGWRPYSIKIGNKYYSYQNKEPYYSILGFAADCFTMFQAFNPNMNIETEERITNALTNGARAFYANFIDKTGFRSSINALDEIFDIVDSNDTKRWGKFLAGRLSGAMPYSSAVRQISGLFTSTSTKPEGFTETLFNRYLNQGLGDYRRNIWGERQDLYNLIITNVSEASSNPEDEEIQRLGSLGFVPSELSPKDPTFKYDYRDFNNKYYGKSLHDLFLETQSEITLEGKTLREAIRELVLSDEYQIMPDGIDVIDKGSTNTKINNIKAIFKRYRDAAKEKVLNNFGADFINKDGRTALEEQQLIREAQEERRLNTELEQTTNDIRSFD